MRKQIKKVPMFIVTGLVILCSNFFTILAQAAINRIDFSLTEEEREYVEHAGSITVAISPDNFPYSSYEDGYIVGIIPEIIELISYETGVQFEVILCESYEEYSSLKTEQTAQVVFATHVSEEVAQEAGYRKTEDYLTIPYSKLELRKNKAGTGKVAVLDFPAPEYEVALRYYYKDQLLICENKEKCMEALDNQECDAIIINSYSAQDVLYSDIRNQYAVKQLHENEVSVAAGVRWDQDERLYAILNRALSSLDNLTLQEIVNRNTQILDNGDSLIEVFYTHPEIVLLVSSIIVLFLLFAFISFVRGRRTSLAQKQAEEYKRFLGYICTACDSVAEVNLKTKQVTRYIIKDDVVEEKIIKNNIEHLFFVLEEEQEQVKEQLSRENVYEIIKEGQVRYFECRMKWNEEDTYRWHNCIVQGILPSQEKPASFLFMIKDIDETKQKDEQQKKALEDAFEQAKQASMAKGQFLSRMSHEIRTPLNAVIGYMSIGKEEYEHPEKMLHCIEKSEIAAKHLLSIINDVLDISSIESGKMKIALADFDMKSLLSEITTVFFQQAKQKDIRFEVNVRSITEEWVVGDSLRVKQVLMNLLSNAVKFTPKQGTIRLKVEQLQQNNSKIYFSFEVSDTGIGMSKEYMSRLFQPFEQEDASTAQKYGGSGLGLSITKNLIDMMGGIIQVQSEQNKGTNFKITLYFGKSDHNVSQVFESRDYSKVRVLVVDDEKDDAVYIKSLLKRCHVKSDSVTSGEAALKQLKRRIESDYSYDMCILDWNMPGLDGVETARKIRASYGSQLPIIIATAYDTTEVETQAFKAGVNRVIAKPLFQSTMFDILVSNFGKYSPIENITDDVTVELEGLHILLAEDNEMNMEIGMDVLNRVGIEVDPAVNGQEACDKFLQSDPGTYDLILMDIQMPLMNGYEAALLIRNSNHSEANTIPIIAMTANAFAEDVAEALAHGMNDHISKPIDRQKLLKAIQRLTKNSVHLQKLS